MPLTEPAPIVADELIEDLDGSARLIGSRCRACAAVTFPRQASCPRCTSTAVDRHLLGTSGTLWSWTVQRFAPKSPPYAVADPETFTAFGVGYVELPGELRVETRLTTADPAELRIGMTMELTLIEAPGGGARTYAFAPTETTR